MIRFNDAHKDQELRYFGQEILLTAQDKGPLTDAKYKAELARNQLLSRAQGIDLTVTKYNLVALVAPTGGPAWFTDLVNGDGGTASAPGPSTVTSVAGYPHITVPMGFVRGLPVGLSFFGRAWSEATLIKLAYAYEQATGHRVPPGTTPSAELPHETWLGRRILRRLLRSRWHCVCGRNGSRARSRAADHREGEIELLPQLVKPHFGCWDIGANTGTTRSPCRGSRRRALRSSPCLTVSPRYGRSRSSRI